MISKSFNFINQKILIIIFLFCIFTACLSLFIVNSNRIVFAQVDKTDDIKIESITCSSEKYNLVIHYPATKNISVNNIIKTFIDTCISKVKSDAKYYIPDNSDDKFNLHIDYDTQWVNHQIVSFIFLINYSNNKNINNIKISTMSYNLNLGKEITINNFFEKGSNYEVALCDKSKEYLQKESEIDDKVLHYFIDDITNISRNSFDGYAFSNTHLSIYFNANKISSKYNNVYEVKIPWDDVKHLLKKNVYIDN